MQGKPWLRRTVVSALASGAGLGAATAAHAQPGTNWPNRPIRILVPYAAGGSTESLTMNSRRGV